MAAFRICLVLFSLLAAGPAHAIDLGSFGKTYAIAEPDFLEEMESIARRKVADGEWKRIMLGARDRALDWLKEPTPVPGLSTARRNRRIRFDPSIVLSRNLYDGDGRLLYRAGTRVNPADIVPFDEELLFIDGRDRTQLKLAENQIARWGPTLKIVLVGGSPAALMAQWNRRVYFDQKGALTGHFHLHSVPDLVYQASPRDRFLTIDVIKP